MAVKKNYGRFCVQFNLSDPRHLQAIEILERQGRRKAQFIVDIVLGTAITDMSSLQQLVETIVKQLLAQQPALKPPAAPGSADNDLKSAIQGIMAAWGPG
jgi:hypothetical protein